VLTKPLGTGIVATAIKQGKASSEMISAATSSMATLNRTGSEVAREHGVRALTDVTGFGLLGHLTEMCRASGVSAEVWFDRLPLLPGAEDLVRSGVAPGGTRRNLDFVEPWTDFEAALDPWQRLLCADAQTSGGLLLAVHPDMVEAVVRALTERQTASAAVIGTIRAAGEPLLSVRSAAPKD